MKLENAKKIVNHLTSQNVKVSLRENYSGRGMFGKTTTGVVSRYTDEIFIAMGELGIKDTRRTDNMGLDMIVY